MKRQNNFNVAFPQSVNSDHQEVEIIHKEIILPGTTKRKSKCVVHTGNSGVHRSCYFLSLWYSI